MSVNHFQNQPQSTDTTTTASAVVDNGSNTVKSSGQPKTATNPGKEFGKERQQSGGIEASAAETCRMCGSDHHCFGIKDASSQLYKVICGKTDANNVPEGWKHKGIARDGRSVFVKSGYKHRNERKNQKFPNSVNLQPSPKPDIPQWQDVNIPVEQVDSGHTVRLKPGNPGGTDTLYIVEKIESQRKQGDKVSLAAKLKRADTLIGTLTIPLDDIAEIVTHDPATGAYEQFIEYHYSDEQKVVRKQWTDRRPVYKNKTKYLRPYYRIKDGEWVSGKGDNPWLLYRHEEAVQTLKDGGIVFVVGGEQAVESVRGHLELTATCNVGGEGGLSLIAEQLATALLEPPSITEQLADNKELYWDSPDSDSDNPQLPLLVIWGDRDETGFLNATKLLKECYKNGVTAVILDPISLWDGMPEKGDAKDWLEYCQREGISREEMYLRLEFAIEQAIDSEEQAQIERASRQAWNAPTSYNGEIGYWKTKIINKATQQTVRYFEPACNFDFQVEREVEDSDGGGLVLQVKRSFENHQIRVILNSCDYTRTDTFTDAMKRSLGTGVICNLNKFQLNALIHTRLHEYRTTRKGKIFKRVDRYGIQADGTWVFSDRQFKKDGTPTSEDESGWVFNPNLGKDDYIPCPQLAPASIDPITALKELIEASRVFFTPKNFHQAILVMGAATAGLYYQDIRAVNKCHPQVNLYGEAGSQKTNAAETALSLIGTNWYDDAMFARISASALYEHASRTGSLPFVWDDPPRDPKNEELGKLLFNGKPRKVRGNEQMPHSPMIIATNHAFGESQAATYSRYNRINFYKINSPDIIDPLALQKLSHAQVNASAAFPLLLSLGYHHPEVLKLEAELLPHLTKAHNRTPKGFAIIIWYAQALINLVGGSENIKQWVIDNICQSENDSDNTGDSLADFIAKIQVLEAESMVGDWNFRRDVTKNGRNYYAIYATDVWKLVDSRFSPATYNEKSLKSLVQKLGGIVDTTVRFASDKDLVLAYKRASINASPEFPPTPPESKARKAWLLPVELFGEFDFHPDSDNNEDPDLDGGKDGGSGFDPSPPPPPSTFSDVTERNLESVTPPKQDSASTSTPSTTTCNRVTDSYLEKYYQNNEKSSLPFKVDDSVEFKDFDCDYWRRGRICDLKQEKGILIYATVEYFVKGQKTI